jgi:selenide, water dikinase
LTALAISAFPKDTLDHATLRQIFLGGFDKLREAGVVLLGGHTVQDAEIKFGYAVTGAADPARILTNAGAKPGDALFLTKPIGTGIVGTAIKFDRVPAAVADQAVRSMRTLNRAASEALQDMPAGVVHACTDVTGFGLIGHAAEIATASNVALIVEAAHVPRFEGVLPLVAQNRSGGLTSNREYFGEMTDVEPSVALELLDLLYDPQTSGGLLVAVARDAVDRMIAAFDAAGISATRIGEVRSSAGGARVVVRA